MGNVIKFPGLGKVPGEIGPPHLGENVADAPEMLRKLADDIENGTLPWAGTLLVVIPDHGYPDVLNYGDGIHSGEAIALLEFAKAGLVQSTLDKTKGP